MRGTHGDPVEAQGCPGPCAGGCGGLKLPREVRPWPLLGAFRRALRCDVPSACHEHPGWEDWHCHAANLARDLRGEADEEAQERPVGAAAPRRDGEKRARRGDGPPRGGLFPDERQESAVGCLRASADCCQRLGVSVRRVAADNGPCCTRPGRSPPRASISGPGTPDQALHAQDPRRRRASSRRPERERDCARTYETSEQRADRLSGVDAHARLAPVACRLGVEAAYAAACGWSGTSHRGSTRSRSRPCPPMPAHARPCPPMPAHARHRLFAGFPMLAGTGRALDPPRRGGRSGRLASCGLEPNPEDPASKA